jgi:hypothetical protein
VSFKAETVVFVLDEERDPDRFREFERRPVDASRSAVTSGDAHGIS